MVTDDVSVKRILDICVDFNIIYMLAIVNRIPRGFMFVKNRLKAINQ